MRNFLEELGEYMKTHHVVFNISRLTNNGYSIQTNHNYIDLKEIAHVCKQCSYEINALERTEKWSEKQVNYTYNIVCTPQMYRETTQQNNGGTTNTSQNKNPRDEVQDYFTQLLIQTRMNGTTLQKTPHYCNNRSVIFTIRPKSILRNGLYMLFSDTRVGSIMLCNGYICIGVSMSNMLDGSLYTKGPSSMYTAAYILNKTINKQRKRSYKGRKHGTT